MQEFLILTSDDEHFQEAFDSLHNRSLLYDKDNNKFGIVYDGFNVINSYVDDVNIKITDDKISLSDDVLVKSTKVNPLEQVKFNGILAENAITDQKSIYLLLKHSDEQNESICGELFRLGENISEMYHISVSSNGQNKIFGSSTNLTEAEILKFSFSGIIYYGIKFKDKNTSSLYFHGYSNIDNLKPPMYTNYRDNQLNVVE